MRFLFSNGQYGDVMPRMAGALCLGLGVLVIQIIRHKVDSLYATLIGVRLMFCFVWMTLYLKTSDPFFLVVFFVVAFGMAWTAATFLRERSASGRV